MHHPPSEHPGRAELQAFGLGNLDAEEARTVEQHVSDCAACCEALEALADDSLVAALRPDAAPAGDTAVPVESDGSAGRPAPADGAPLPELAGHPRYRVVALLGTGGMGA